MDKTKLQPVIGGDWHSIEFKSSAPIPDLSAEPSDDARVGTLGNSIFDIPSHAIHPGRAAVPASLVVGVKAAEEPSTRRITRSSTSVSGPVANSARVAASTDYHAMWASSEWSPPDNATDFNCFATKPVVASHSKQSNPDKSKSQ